MSSATDRWKAIICLPMGAISEGDTTKPFLAPAEGLKKFKNK